MFRLGGSAFLFDLDRQSHIPRVGDAHLQVLEMPVVKLLSFRRCHADAGGVKSLVQHGVKVEVNRLFEVHGHLTEQGLLLQILRVAGVEVIQVAVEDTVLRQGVLQIRATLVMLHHH